MNKPHTPIKMCKGGLAILLTLRFMHRDLIIHTKKKKKKGSLHLLTRSAHRIRHNLRFRTSHLSELGAYGDGGTDVCICTRVNVI